MLWPTVSMKLSTAGAVSPQRHPWYLCRGWADSLEHSGQQPARSAAFRMMQQFTRSSWWESGSATLHDPDRSCTSMMFILLWSAAFRMMQQFTRSSWWESGSAMWQPTRRSSCKRDISVHWWAGNIHPQFWTLEQRLTWSRPLMVGIPAYLQQQLLQSVLNPAAPLVFRLDATTTLLTPLQSFTGCVYHNGSTIKSWSWCIEHWAVCLCHIQSRQSARQLRSSSKPLLCKLTTKTHFANRAFRCSAPAVWNSLPADIVDCTSLAAFRTRLKTYLFRVAFRHCQHWLYLSAGASEVFWHTGAI